MNPELKYLIFNTEPDSMVVKACGIIFPASLSHRQVSRIHRAGDVALISAGFCRWSPEDCKWTVYGKSESLGGMAARPEDAEILLQSFPLHQE